MPRTLFALLAVSLALSSSLACDASGGGEETVADVAPKAPAQIVLRGRQGSEAPWRPSLSLNLRLSELEVTSFAVCAIWDRASSPLPPDCRPPVGTRLPSEATLRLEQRRSGPGWRTVGTSTDPALQAILSNTVSGNRPGPVSYRVTLRGASGRVLRTSNTFVVHWNE
jgi:hypothetical protein